MNNKIKYFDYASTTPCESEVIQEMIKHLSIENNFGNPHSRNHEFGWNAEKVIENARKSIADLINANEKEIIFTSGATESNNLAIKGYALGPDYKGGTILSIETEHKCVIESLRYLKHKDFPVEFLQVENSGLLNLDLLKEKVKDAEFLSISYVNNETGVIQNISEISKICRANNVILHVDAAQAFGKINIDAREIDMISISAHKIYGPKGIGALFVSKNPRVRISPLIHGGGQERNLRSGTLATSLCAGFGKAAEIAKIKMQEDYERASKFQTLLLNSFTEEDVINLNGDPINKIPHIVNINIPYIEGESMLMKLNGGFALSSGSACTSKSLEPSHIIRAMNPGNKEIAHSSIRICFGRYTEEQDLINLIQSIKINTKKLRELSPLWHLFQEGISFEDVAIKH